ncbi:outer membrane beta-barrel protein [Silvibacterium sp.]|uniref:outer membrane beta-barrel protein n=1 Tax=Silvibacterium sp. TaxID=1964179 RepID=UPI0039E40A12
MLKKLLVCGVLLSTAAALAQSAPSAQGGNATLWVGGEFSSFNPDYFSSRVVGPGVFADFNLTPKLGFEGEARFMNWHGDSGEKESNYLGGVKYRLYRYNRFSLHAKFLLGGDWITYPEHIGNGSYFAFTPGGFVDYRVNRHWAVRGDYEYHFLPAAPGLDDGNPSHGMTPNGFSIGVAYRLLGAR